MARVYAYDADSSERDELIGQLRDGLDLSDDAGHEVVFFSHRNVMLADIAAHPAPCLAFVDLERDPVEDPGYAGHRIIETIRRHPRLRHCRAIAFTAYGYPDVIDLVSKHGAYGLISKHWVDVLRDRKDLDELHGVLKRLLRGSAWPVHDQAGFFWRSPERDEQFEQALEEQALYDVFANTPSYLSESCFWPMVRHLAQEPLGLQAVAHLTHAAFPQRTARTYLNWLEDMPNNLAPEFHLRSRPQYEAARALLAKVPHRRTAPDERVSLAHLGKVHRLAAFAADAADLHPQAQEILEQSWLDDEAVHALKAVLRHITPRGGNVDAHLHAEALERTLRDLSPDTDGRALVPPLIRAVNGILDTAQATRGQSSR